MNMMQCTIIKELPDHHAWWRVTFGDGTHVRHINVLVNCRERREEDCRNEALCRARKDLQRYLSIFDKYGRSSLPYPVGVVNDSAS